MKGCVHSSALPGKTRSRSRRPEVTGKRFRRWWCRVDGEVCVVDVVDLLHVHDRTACSLADDNSAAWNVIVQDNSMSCLGQLVELSGKARCDAPHNSRRCPGHSRSCPQQFDDKSHLTSLWDVRENAAQCPGQLDELSGTTR